MTQTNSAFIRVPAAMEDNANRLLNVIFQDVGDNLSIRLSVSGSEPATWVTASVNLTNPTWWSWFGDLAAAIQADDIAPEGGWPLMDGETTVLTKAHALAVANVMGMNTKSKILEPGESIVSLAKANRGAALASEAPPLKIIVPA